MVILDYDRYIKQQQHTDPLSTAKNAFYTIGNNREKKKRTTPARLDQSLNPDIPYKVVQKVRNLIE